MQNLSKSKIAKLNKGVKNLFSLLKGENKAEAQKEKEALISAFGKDNVEKAFNDYVSTIPQILSLNASNNVPDALSNAEGISEAEINNDLLDALSAIGITDKLKENSGKSIFKKEFNNKADRTKCRNKIQNLFGLYLVHLAHNKSELAGDVLVQLKGIAKQYYIAEDNFKSEKDYCTDNMDANKKGLIKLFIETYNKGLVPA